MFHSSPVLFSSLANKNIIIFSFVYIRLNLEYNISFNKIRLNMLQYLSKTKRKTLQINQKFSEISQNAEGTLLINNSRILFFYRLHKEGRL